MTPINLSDVNERKIKGSTLKQKNGIGKYLLAPAVGAGMLAYAIWPRPDVEQAGPYVVYERPKYKGIERVIEKKEMPDYKPKIQERTPEIKKERKFDNDKIYEYINPVYEEANIPEVITKKYVRATIKVESKDKPRATSRVKAKGLMQLMRGAWSDVDKKRDYDTYAFDPEINVENGTKYLALLSKQLKKSYPGWEKLESSKKRDLITAAYNGGFGRLKRKKWNISKMPYETRNHIRKINKTMAMLE